MAKRAKIQKWGPRTARTRELWEDADRRWLLRDHPEDCAVCASTRAAGLNNPDWIIENHKAHLAKITAEAVAAARRRKAAAESYYADGVKLTIDGAPCRVSAHVAKWKPDNKKALGQGFDVYGLTLRPRNKRGFLYESPSRRRLSYVACKELGPAEEISPAMKRSGYGLVAGRLFRRQIYTSHGTLSEYLSDHTRPFHYSNGHNRPAFRPAPDLWTAARIARRRVAALTRHATSDYVPHTPETGRETHAACGDSRPTAQRHCVSGSQ